MISNKSVLGVIPARGGSKGLPRKNLLDVGGKPLIAWSIEGARMSRYLDRVIVSTEDKEIAEIAKKWGGDVPFMRPQSMAEDDTSIHDALIHALDNLDEDEAYDYVVLLQPTSPMRRAEDIDQCLELIASAKAPACVSVCEPAKSPYWMFQLDDNHRMTPLIEQGTIPYRRQDTPPVYALNGAVYVADVDWYKNNKTFLCDDAVAYRMPTDRSVDIDSVMDWKLANLLLMPE